MSGAVSVAPAEAARARAAIRYEVIATPPTWTMCVGETVELRARIVRYTRVNGRQYDQFVAGGYVLASNSNDQVGIFDPSDGGRSVGAAPDPVARFLFRARASGRTRIDFVIRFTGEERRVGTGFPERGDSITIEVTDCFDAYTSGLGTTFSTKDMGDLTEWFLLEGRIASATVAGNTQIMFFIPNPQNRTKGGYVFVDTAWATADPRARCTAYVSGRYDVVLYPNADKPVEGDLLMQGTGVQVCAAGSYEIDYTNQTGFQIAFRPRTAP